MGARHSLKLNRERLAKELQLAKDHGGISLARKIRIIAVKNYDGENNLGTAEVKLKLKTALIIHQEMIALRNGSVHVIYSGRHGV